MMDAPALSHRERRVARIALAMLPVGGTLTVISATAVIAVLLLAIDIIVRRPSGTGWWLAWCLAALLVAWRNLRRAIEVMSAFDWRPMPGIVLLSTLIVVACPGWWLG